MKKSCPLCHVIAGMAVLTLAMALSTPAQSLVTVSPPTQTLFEADVGTGNINEFTPGGAQSTFSSLSGLSGPLAFDDAGNLFVGTAASIIEITPSGVQSAFSSPLAHTPGGLTFSSSGDLFATDGNSIIQITPEGVQSTFATGIMGNAAYLAFDSTGNLFVTPALGSRMSEVASNGTVNVFASGTGAYGALAFDSEGDLFTAHGNDVYEFLNNDGALSSTPIFFASGLDGPTALVFDSAGDLFESDSGTGDINEFIDSDGTLSSTPVVFASGLNDPAGLAFAPVPEPSPLALLSIGTATLLIRRRKN